jgi:hypothetical protein
MEIHYAISGVGTPRSLGHEMPGEGKKAVD